MRHLVRHLAPALAAALLALPSRSGADDDRSTYLAFKFGGFGSSGTYQGNDFGGATTWELAVGTGRVLGVEISGGSMTTSAGELSVRTIPLLLSLRLAIPIAMVSPFLEGGGGAYFNEASLRGRSVDDVTAGWHVGAGVDVHVGRVLVGAQGRYMGIAPTFSSIGTLTLDRYEILGRIGILF
ncbi:MAG TPA: outer membrane beta-barrel protein [Anaeromyxobacteraceae bacterium]|nr:outer membrane beta-barrel protein [Anaeromyxobacteraceae bacterium]